ncbi:MAG: DUF2437 domain-containing protein, partial [Planctomycetaceae bacterium]|nr:DUF2437 domain-containing protein [Planctomycetaceae bacterium]
MFASRSLFAALFVMLAAQVAQAEKAQYVRFQKGDTIAYGLVEGDRVRQLAGDLFAAPTKTDTTFAMSEITLLP